MWNLYSVASQLIFSVWDIFVYEIFLRWRLLGNSFKTHYCHTRLFLSLSLSLCSVLLVYCMYMWWCACTCVRACVCVCMYIMKCGHVQGASISNKIKSTLYTKYCEFDGFCMYEGASILCKPIKNRNNFSVQNSSFRICSNLKNANELKTQYDICNWM